MAGRIARLTPEGSNLVFQLSVRPSSNVANASLRTHTDVLNRFEMIATDVRKQLEQARHIAKYVFPRQYALSHPFAVKTDGQFVDNEMDWMNREEEIKVGRCYVVVTSKLDSQSKAQGARKTPKRLRQVLPLLEKLIWHHGKCAYKPLIQKLCPSKVRSVYNDCAMRQR